MEELKDFFVELGTTAGVKILFGLVVLVAGLKLTKLIVRIMGKGKGFNNLEPSVQSFIKSFARIVLYALVISSSAIIWGIPSTSFMTVFASAGVAIGLALQGALSNFAGGLMILFFKPFKVGDSIEYGGYSGTVKEITVIYTILLTFDNRQVTIPNGKLTNSEVLNMTAEECVRVNLTFSADYNSDVEAVKKLLLSTGSSHPLVLKSPEPIARLLAHGSSSLDYTLRVWCKNTDYWTVYFDLMEQVKKVFDENNISIPFPQLDIHMDKQ